MPHEYVENLYEPLRLPAEDMKKLAEDLATEVKNALEDRQPLIDRWVRAHKLFEGIREAKNFPFKDSANTNIPLVPTHGSAIHARFMTSTFGGEPFWTVKSKNPEFQDFAEAATEYLDWSQRNEMGLYEAVRDAVWDAVKLGLGVLKGSWVRKEGKKRKYVRGEKGKMRLVEEEGIIENRPKVEAIPPHLFVWAPGSTDIQSAPWVAQIHRMHPEDVRAMFKGSAFNGEKKEITDTATYILDDSFQRQLEKNEGIFAARKDIVELYEIWARKEIKGRLEEIKIILEPSTYAVAAAIANPILNRRRPFTIIRLEAREHSITGIGVADMIGDLNEEMNTVHNQTIDATTVSICGMFGVRPGTETWDVLDQIWPGKRIPMFQEGDVKEIGLGPLKVNSLPLEEYLRSYAERRTGISDFGLGREPSPARRGTATGTMAIIQEGNKKFDYQISDIRRGTGELGMLMLSLIQQMYPDGHEIKVLGADGAAFDTIRLIFPEDTPVEEAVAIEVQSNSASINRQMQQQNAMTLFQVMMSFYQQSFQLAQVLATPGLPPPLIELGAQMAKGGEVLMKDILASFENRKADDLIPDLEELYAQIGALGLAMGLAAQSGMGGPQGAPGGMGGSGEEGGAGGESRAPSGGVPQ